MKKNALVLMAMLFTNVALANNVPYMATFKCVLADQGKADAPSELSVFLRNPTDVAGDGLLLYEIKNPHIPGLNQTYAEAHTFIVQDDQASIEGDLIKFQLSKLQDNMMNQGEKFEASLKFISENYTKYVCDSLVKIPKIEDL